MLRLVRVPPVCSRELFDEFLPWQDNASDALSSVKDILDYWDEGVSVMRPRHSLRHWRARPYSERPGWRSVRQLRPMLDDFHLLIVGAQDDAPTAEMNNEENERTQMKNSKKGEEKKCEEEGKERRLNERKKEEKEGKTWQYSVDVSGCDNVRAFTEGGLLVVEGRGRSDGSSVSVRYVTTLPAHVKADSLKATQKDGRLFLSCNASSPAVVNIPIRREAEESAVKAVDGGKETSEAESKDSQEPSETCGNLLTGNNEETKSKSATSAA